MVQARVPGLPLAGGDGGCVTSPSRVPGFSSAKQGRCSRGHLSCGGCSMPSVDTLQTLSEDLLKEGRREGMRVLVSMWISCL